MGSISNNKNDGANIAVTDNGNYIVDLFFTAPIADVALAAKELKATVGKCLSVYVCACMCACLSTWLCVCPNVRIPLSISAVSVSQCGCVGEKSHPR